MFFLYTIFCSYKKIIKKMTSGLDLPIIDDKIKFLGVTSVDIILTICLAYILSHLWDLSFWLIFIILFLFGFLLHLYLCRKDLIDFSNQMIKKINPNTKLKINDYSII